MMRRVYKRCLSYIAVFLTVIASCYADIDPSKVIILVNENSIDSISLAHYYVEKRDVPVENIVSLKLSLKEEITWKEFTDTLYNPLIEWAVTNSWVKASPSDQFDRIGRKFFGVTGHSVDFLILSKDVPLKIRNDASLMATLPTAGKNKQFMVNNASVDSELSLLPFPQAATVAFVHNPLFEKMDPGNFSMQQIIRVSRLAGHSYAAAKMLIDQALMAEKYGLAGRAYIDFSKRHEQGDVWLKEAGEIIESLGFDVAYEYDKELFGWGDRFDAPALYFGWYSRDLIGPISDPFFKFPPGAMAIHLHSYTAMTVRSKTKEWVGPLVARGVTATAGNVYEPYLPFIHHPDLFMKAIKKGKTFGEAGYYALAALSWQEILVGDPMYRPFKISLDEQLALIDQDPFPYAQYAVIRKMNLLIADGKHAEASELGIEYFNKISGMALLFAIAKCQFDMQSPDAAVETLALVSYFNPIEPHDLAIVYEIAQYLEEKANYSLALKLYNQLLSQSHMDNRMAILALPSAIQLANKQSETSLSIAWANRLAQLTQKPE